MKACFVVLFWCTCTVSRESGVLAQADRMFMKKSRGVQGAALLLSWALLPCCSGFIALPGLVASSVARFESLCSDPATSLRTRLAVPSRARRGTRRGAGLVMSAARGDACLAAAAKALGDGDLAVAQENLENARLEYLKAGVEDRNELVEQIRTRIAGAGMEPPRPPGKSSMSDTSAAFGERLRLAKQEGDTVLAEAARMLSQKEYESARILANKARELFERAGPAIARERAPIVGNLISYIQIEEERAVLMQVGFQVFCRVHLPLRVQRMRPALCHRASDMLNAFGAFRSVSDRRRWRSRRCASLSSVWRTPLRPSWLCSWYRARRCVCARYLHVASTDAPVPVVRSN